MNKKIWKYELLDGCSKIEMPKDSEVLTVQTQNENICIWALVNPDKEIEVRVFEVYGTGYNIYCDMGIERKYIGTIKVDSDKFVFHVFERIN